MVFEFRLEHRNLTDDELDKHTRDPYSLETSARGTRRKTL